MGEQTPKFKPNGGTEKKRKGGYVLNAKHPRIGFPGYGFDSTPGSRMGMGGPHCHNLGPGPAVPDASGPIATAPTPAGPGGPGDGGGGCGACGESVESMQIDAILESFEKDHPNSDVVAEVRKVFDGIKDGNGAIYHSCDGYEAIDDTSPTSDTQISALAASCEAALNAFKEYTGYDYFAWRSK